MAGLQEQRNCPYCGRAVRLGDCRVVGTNPNTIARVEKRDGFEFMPSRAPVKGWVESGVARYPVLADPPNTALGNGVTRIMSKLSGRLPPVTDLAPAEDLPARLCPACSHPLPVGMDDRPVYTIAVVGTNHAGKTHYLASMIRDAYRMQGLAAFGCVEFMPDELTAGTYDRGYFEPVFESASVLPVTSPTDPVRFTPLVFQVTFAGAAPCLVLFHDVSGEVLADRAKRADAASFVRRADGVIFLVDPLSFPAVRGLFRDNPDVAPRPANQANLLSACVADLSPTGRTRVPFAVTLSKSDLLAAALPERRWLFARRQPADPHEWDVEMKAVENEVRYLLQRLNAHDLLAATTSVANTSFHAVSPLGQAPAPDGALLAPATPIRCLEPLVTVLHRIPRIVGA